MLLLLLLLLLPMLMLMLTPLLSMPWLSPSEPGGGLGEAPGLVRFFGLVSWVGGRPFLMRLEQWAPGLVRLFGLVSWVGGQAFLIKPVPRGWILLKRIRGLV